ncbi:sigma-70 family RNA polymerase sigma factor [Sediminibacterium sp.]|jgi:RNA polymerase sigma factor (sigma-70 family)|uniref:RNA polymerase sigma factor n=1 Tax=Sediminibacterium sp. TaxID=1917865 RepID=UPI0025CDB912|nr:sigma-70 family RNA polymerase sigma factor [Sediminibacterium sp.]MBW0176741.1 sigma-70 family RNA polymerase sigma factor [Sediminibacterium sp.]
MSEPTQNTEQLIDHLFRHQSGKMVAVLTHIVGLQQIHLVEDIVQDSFISALQHWKMKGIPDEPAAWLMQTAKNKAIDLLRRLRYHARYIQSQSAFNPEQEVESFFHEQEMNDSELRMIFACCHPTFSKEDQVALTLKLVFSFSVSEIARALLVSDAAMQKRLLRAKELLKNGNITLEIPAGKQLQERLSIVRTTLYLLFNEGYLSHKKEEIIRHDLCMEAIRCAKIITEHPATKEPINDALLALLCLHAARFDSRISDSNDLILLEQQDRNLWDRDLIKVGYHYLNLASETPVISQYHIEAAIAAEHSMAKSFADTNWSRILILYNLLAEARPSPAVTLNRAIVLSQLGETEKAIAQVLSIGGIEQLIRTDHQYASVLGYLYMKLSDRIKALSYLQQAKHITNSPAEQKLLQARIDLVSNN